ncbi:hypothetical protein DVH24_032960 [Malus domestica]|uniref:Uncharacterized protein n=1 Tax=Malus domestica TaxID=3750 RepID=A0A498IMU2_MALDO|nr:hypothetical protein DVH24_032960 [Malus domestica]
MFDANRAAMDNLYQETSILNVEPRRLEDPRVTKASWPSLLASLSSNAIIIVILAFVIEV